MIAGSLIRVVPFAGRLAKRWWRKRDLAKNLSRAVVAAIDAHRMWPPGVREELVVQWDAVRVDPQVTHLVRRLIDDRSAEDERRLRARVHQLLTDLDLTLGVDETADRLVRVIVRSLSEAQATPEQRHRADMISLEDKLDASADRALEVLDRLPSGSEGTSERVLATFQLPSDIGDFTDRERETSALVDSLTDRAPHGAPAITVVTGKPGVGKSALAIHASHRLSGQFPDAQLYAYLGDVPTADSTLVVTGFLEALGAEHIPESASQREALFRHMTRERRLLIVLDGASKEQQVRPLIPTGMSSAVIVTSRAPLSGLEGVSEVIDVDTLADRDGADLLSRMLEGDPRLLSQQNALHEVAVLCGGLPLALHIAGARLRARRNWTIAEFASRLADQRRRLDELATGDREVRASFALSYDELSAPGRRLFGFAGALLGPTLDRTVAAAMLGVSPENADSLLDELADAHLLDVVDDERYAMHDLLRLFARERLATCLTVAEIGAGLHRMLQGFVERVLAAAQAIDSTPEESIAWFERERPNLLGAVELAYAREDWFGTWLLAMVASPLYERTARWDEWQRTHELALDAVRRIDELPEDPNAPEPREMEAQILSRLGMAYLGAGQTEQAIARHREALTLASDRSDRASEASVLHDIANALAAAGRYEEAVACDEQALAIAQDDGNTGLEAAALNGLGIARFRAGELEPAARYLERSLAIKRRMGDRLGEARTLANLGNVARRDDRWAEAKELYRDSARIYAQASDRYGEARSELDLAVVEADLGERDTAKRRLERVLAIQVELGSQRDIAWTLVRLTHIARAEHNPQAATAYATESLERFQRIGDPEGEAEATNALALIAAELGDLDEATAYHQANLATLRDLGDRRGQAATLGNLGAVSAMRGQLGEAGHQLRMSIELFQDLQDARGAAISNSDLGGVLAALGDHDGAEQLFSHSLGVFRAIGDEPNASQALTNLVDLYADTGRIDRAIELYDEAIGSRRDRDDARGQAKLLVALGSLLGRSGETETARGVYRQALAIPDALSPEEAHEVRQRISE